MSGETERERMECSSHGQMTRRQKRGKQSDTCLLRADKTHYDRTDADEDEEKCEEESQGKMHQKRKL